MKRPVDMMHSKQRNLTRPPVQKMGLVTVKRSATALLFLIYIVKEKAMNTCIYKNCDCFELLKSLPTGSIDLILIDPPYGISKDTNFTKSKPTGDKEMDKFRRTMDFGEWDHESVDIERVIKEGKRVLREGGTFICFYDIWKLETLKSFFDANHYNQIRFVEWIKNNPIPINSKRNYLTNAREVMISAIKGRNPTFNSSYDKGIYEVSACKDKGRFHPTQKPIELIKQLIEKHSNEGDTILDCFAGSCTTGVAALELNRNFVGCELDEEYYTKSLERFKPFQIKIET